MHTSDLDIVLPVHINQPSQMPMTVKCIDTLRETAPEANIIIVETANDFEDYADKHYSTDRKTSYAQNVNIGLAFSSRKYILIASNDVFPEKKWVKGMARCFEDPLCGVATLLSTQFNEEPRDLVEEGFFGGFWVVSRDCWQKVGNLDERFINCFEDSDYWIRVKLAGYKLRINRGVTVEHLVSRTVSNEKNHNENYLMGRRIFNEKHKDCGLELFERLK